MNQTTYRNSRLINIKFLMPSNGSNPRKYATKNNKIHTHKVCSKKNLAVITQIEREMKEAKGV